MLCCTPWMFFIFTTWILWAVRYFSFGKEHLPSQTLKERITFVLSVNTPISILLVNFKLITVFSACSFRKGAHRHITQIPLWGLWEVSVLTPSFCLWALLSGISSLGWDTEWGSTGPSRGESLGQSGKVLGEAVRWGTNVDRWVSAQGPRRTVSLMLQDQNDILAHLLSWCCVDNGCLKYFNYKQKK